MTILKEYKSILTKISFKNRRHRIFTKSCVYIREVFIGYARQIVQTIFKPI
ncbi:hypothetical protein TSAR_000147 [Trichomalopsis sarcophagae]|uniref:Uncharacterized protein n=1 Tax=Trichomalopsis sarcophagae TaxID=543379 RepID=A0A232FCY3_9HYME|nr:hypothetical protein TSAR_000147 [Trichomalopsis sarcophagae]